MAVAALLVIGFLAHSAEAMAQRPSPYRHSLSRVDAHLRFAIEFGPRELGEDLRSSELVCRLGLTSEERGEAERAAADWSTLDQLVERLDMPAAAAVQGAFERAGLTLLSLREKFSAAWRGDHPRIAELRKGVAQTRRGIRAMRVAVRQIEAAFPAWNERQCNAATAAIQNGAANLPAGLELINGGMQGLWRL
ncbi:MAG: hypothetical protein JJE35_12100 [Thermoleophilia bacterium]|nr:hypothetical protein [Thermoleophilia bacterium]